jgi:hypothetical protein
MLYRNDTFWFLTSRSMAMRAAPPAPRPGGEPGVLLAVPRFRQQRSLSCEMAALRMAAAFQGVAKSETDLVALLPADRSQPRAEGQHVVWADAERLFAGNIRGWQLVYGGLHSYPSRARRGAWGYGVHAPGIAEVAARLGLEAQLFDSADQVFRALDRGNPVVVIVPCSGKSTARKWMWYTSKGVVVDVIDCEHAITVRGYDERRVFVHDPLGAAASYARGVFQRAFDLLKSGVEIGPPRHVVPAPGRLAPGKLPRPVQPTQER